MGAILARTKENLAGVRVGDSFGFYRHADVDVLFDFIEQVRESDVTHEEIKALQVSVLHGGILTNADKLMVSRTLGVLGSILTDARA